MAVRHTADALILATSFAMRALPLLCAQRTSFGTSTRTSSRECVARGWRGEAQRVRRSPPLAPSWWGQPAWARRRALTWGRGVLPVLPAFRPHALPPSPRPARPPHAVRAVAAATAPQVPGGRARRPGAAAGAQAAHAPPGPAAVGAHALAHGRALPARDQKGAPLSRRAREPTHTPARASAALHLRASGGCCGGGRHTLPLPAPPPTRRPAAPGVVVVVVHWPSPIVALGRAGSSSVSTQSCAKA